jgi:hypothetical protein
VADWLFATAVVLAVPVGAAITHLLFCDPYKAALTRIVDAASDPHNRGLDRALDDADELLGRRR